MRRFLEEAGRARVDESVAEGRLAAGEDRGGHGARCAVEESRPHGCRYNRARRPAPPRTQDLSQCGILRALAGAAPR